MAKMRFKEADLILVAKFHWDEIMCSYVPPSQELSLSRVIMEMEKICLFVLFFFNSNRSCVLNAQEGGVGTKWMDFGGLYRAERNSLSHPAWPFGNCPWSKLSLKSHLEFVLKSVIWSR